MTRVPARRPGVALLLLVLVGLLVAGCSTPAETGRYSATLVTQREHAVGPGESLLGDTVVAGGAMELAEGSEHLGSLTVLAGEARIAGRISGDLMVLGGSAALTETAEVGGDVAVAGGSLTRAPDALVRGTLTESPDPTAVLGRTDEPTDPVDRVLAGLAGIVALAGLGWLAARVAPRPLQRTQAAATGFPVVSGALGALVLITVLPLVVSMVFTLFLIPLAGLVLVGLVVTTGYGLLALGRGLGLRILRTMGRSATTGSGPAAVALGTAVLVTGLQLATLVPFVGGVAVAVLVVVAVGAASLTGFGLRPYTPPADTLEEAATPPPPG